LPICLLSFPSKVLKRSFVHLHLLKKDQANNILSPLVAGCNDDVRRRFHRRRSILAGSTCSCSIVCIIILFHFFSFGWIDRIYLNFSAAMESPPNGDATPRQFRNYHA
jgi:hypothetical protein